MDNKLTVYAIQYKKPNDETLWYKIYPGAAERDKAFEELVELHYETWDFHLLHKVVLTVNIELVTEQLEMEL